MLFTTGNLITLGIVAVVLILYRRLDRDNRSLEKVKKFGDKIRDELAVYVDKRAEDLQRFGIDLDVRQKAAKEALKRLQAVEEGLMARTETMGAVEKRLTEYDDVLARLIDMTGRVDENLSRLREESEFTDTVARKLDAAKRGMAAIESGIPELKDNFSRDAEAALEAFKVELTADVQGGLREASALLERSREAAESSLERAEQGRRDAEKEYARAFERARAEATKLEDSAFEKLKESSDAKAHRLKETVEEKFNQIGQAAKDKAAETQVLIKTLKSEWKADAEQLLTELKAEIAKASSDLDERLATAKAKGAEIGAATAERYAAAEKQVEGMAAALESKIEAIRISADSGSAAVEAKSAERIGEVAKKTEELAHGLSEKLKSLLQAQREDFDRRSHEAKAAATEAAESLDLRARAAREEAEAAARTLTEAVAAASERAEENAARLKAQGDALAARLADQGEASILKALGEMDKRLSEYGSEIEGKFTRLEAVNADISALEGALRAAMEQVERRVENDFAAFGRTLEDKRARFEEGFNADSGRLRESMKTLEEELAALKSRAYENVSEKLKVFEDEFFADLKARSQASDARLAAWKVELDRSLEELSLASREERSAAEKASLEELRARMAETRDRVDEQLATTRARADAVQDGIRAQSDMVAGNLEALRNSVANDAADARKTAQAYVEGELSRFSLETAAKLKNSERELGERLGSLSAEIGAEASRVASAREETLRIAEEFRSGFSKSVAEAEAKARKDFDSFKATTASLIASIKADYEKQRDDYMEKSRADRDRLKEDLSSLADRGAELRSDLTTRISQALEGFSRSYENFLGDLGKKQKEAENEAAAHLREFRDAAAELALKVESGRVQALGKVETEAARLEKVLADIDKEQKAFVAQTKIFERADELKASLAAAIETMKADLTRLDGRKAEIAELDSQLARVKRLEDEVNQKVARFLAEKRRIDALEEDFSRLASVAQGVDKKLEEVTGQSDALTEAQASIRRVLELSSEAEAKYERLEKKAGIIEATTDAVDKNFQAIRDVEKLVGGFGAELKRLPERISDLKRGIEELAAGRERTDEAARRLLELDGIVADIEKRLTEAQKVREWLARAETRLEEVNRQAQEQLKLLSTLLKEESGPRKDRGAPPSSVQDTVRKLARQGWSTDEIARAVKISRGEVELILELGA